MLPRPERSASHVDASVMEGMRAWRAAHPRATFAEIEVEATRQVAALRAALIAAALEAGEPDTAPACAACGRTMIRVGTTTREIITSHQETVTVGPVTAIAARPAGPSFPPSLRRWTWARAAIRRGSWRGRCGWEPPDSSSWRRPEATDT